jgi:hypothetical protein
MVPIRNQINPVHTAPFYLSEIHFNIILSHTSASFWSSISLYLSHQSLIRISLILMHATYLVHLVIIDLITLIILGDKTIIYEAPHYTAFSSLEIYYPFSVQIFSSAPCSQTHLSVYLF